MGRLSELMFYLNEEIHPTELQRQHRYRYLSFTPEVRKLRRKHLAAKRKRKKSTLRSS